MRMLKTKPPLYQIITDNPWDLAAGDVVELINADQGVPENFATIAEPFHGHAPEKVKVVNAEYFRQQRVREEVSDEPRRILSIDEVLRRYFNGDPQLLLHAQGYGFPRAFGRRISAKWGHSDPAIFSAGAIDRWVEQFSAFVAATRFIEK